MLVLPRTRGLFRGLFGALAGPLAAALLAAAIAGCATSVSAGASAGATRLTIYAAASLKAAIGQAILRYEAGHPGVGITLSTDSSAALATQIQQGAPADLFLSADTTNPQRLVEASLAVPPVRAFARNQLAVIVPHGNPAHLTSALDLGRPGLKVVAAGGGVPISTYARQLVRNLAAASPSASNLEAAYEANVVTKEDNVAAVVSKVALGEGDAAIVYATDATATSKVATVPIPDAVNVVATYGGVIVEASPNHAAAAAFLDWLAGPDGQAILATFGFLPP